MEIRLIYGKKIKDTNELKNLSWDELKEYAYKRVGITKDDFRKLVISKRDFDIASISRL